MLDQAALGKRIQNKRKMKGLTQEQLGHSLGVSSQAVSKWENGESAPDIGLLPSLCRCLGTSSDTLLGISSEYQPAICKKTLRADINTFRFGDVEISRSDESVYIKVTFTTAWDDGRIICFNPPDGTVFMLEQPKVIKPGTSTTIFEIRKEDLVEDEVTLKFFPGQGDPPGCSCAYVFFRASDLLAE